MREVAGMVEATAFRPPEELEGLLRRASQLYGDLMGYIDSIAGLKEEDLRSFIILHVAEIYGAVQMAGVLFGASCQEAMASAIKTYSLMLEKVLDWLHAGADSKTGQELDQLAFQFEVGLYLLVAGCAGIPAVVPAPEDKEGGN
jgi:hypothetical protein